MISLKLDSEACYLTVGNMSKIFFGLTSLEQMNCNALFGCLKTGEIYKYTCQCGIPVTHACEAPVVTCFDNQLQLMWNSGGASKVFLTSNEYLY